MTLCVSRRSISNGVGGHSLVRESTVRHFLLSPYRTQILIMLDQPNSESIGKGMAISRSEIRRHPRKT